MKFRAARNPAFLPGLLCLDAPLVAVGWAWLFSLCYRNGYPPIDSSLGLFSAVWSIYLFDRIYDASLRKGGDCSARPLRHAWALRHRKLLGTLLGIALAALTYSGVRLAGRDILEKALFVGIAAVAYFVLFLFLKIPSRGVLPLKEIMIGSCFAGGVYVGSAGSVSVGEYYIDYAMPVIICGSAILFTWNCLLIGKSEQEFDRTTDPSSFHAGSERRNISPWYFLIPLCLFGCGLLLKPRYFPGGLSLLVCGAGLYVLEKYPPNVRFVPLLADGILLFPWIVIAFRHLSR